MPSGFRPIWSDTAWEDLKNIITYLEENWSEKEIRKFVIKLDSRLAITETNTKLFPATNKKKNLRRSVLTHQVTIYYRIDDKNINLLSLFDSRQNPNKLKA